MHAPTFAPRASATEGSYCRKLAVIPQEQFFYPRQEKLTMLPKVVGKILALLWLELKNNRTNEAIEYNFFFHFYVRNCSNHLCFLDMIAQTYLPK